MYCLFVCLIDVVCMYVTAWNPISPQLFSHFFLSCTQAPTMNVFPVFLLLFSIPGCLLTYLLASKLSNLLPTHPNLCMYVSFCFMFGYCFYLCPSFLAHVVFASNAILFLVSFCPTTAAMTFCHSGVLTSLCCSADLVLIWLVVCGSVVSFHLLVRVMFLCAVFVFAVSYP
jgi:hypothetical protein